ncbi:hypothetical protein C8034_v005386 [Colletotrichum sidae]|uniref:Uncharacterized protein n=1 Tax=Colletotrichum sidae TaxID=1347389 RepID=A0A4R8T6D0_9PEZI|nr:hypothetical protein C8034_v005386 [Colletotrichum sidae]
MQGGSLMECGIAWALATACLGLARVLQQFSIPKQKARWLRTAGIGTNCAVLVDMGQDHSHGHRPRATGHEPRATSHEPRSLRPDPSPVPSTCFVLALRGRKKN